MNNHRIEFVLSITFKLLSILLNLYLVSFVIKMVGIEEYGTWSVWLSLISWVCLAEISLGAAYKNYYAERSVYKNTIYIKNEFIGLIYFLFTFSSFFSFLFWLILYCSKDIKFWNQIILLAIYYLPIYFFAFSFSLINAYNYSRNKGYLVYLQQFLLLGTFFILVKYLNYKNIYIYSMLYSLAYFLSVLLISVVILSPCLHKKAINLPHYWERGFIVFKRIYKKSVDFLYIQLAYIMLFSTDRLLISIHGESGSNIASFDIASRMMGMMYIVIAVYCSLQWSKLSNYYQLKNKTKIKQNVLKSYLLILSIFIIFVGVIIFHERIISLWLGDDKHFNGILLIMIIMIFSNLVQSVGAVNAVYYNSIGATKIQFNITLYSIVVKFMTFYVIKYLFDINLNMVAAISTSLSLLIWTVYSSVKINRFIFGESNNFNLS